MILENFNTETFLKYFWQQKHLFIEQALPDFKSPIDPNDLAGLSLEENAESRLILEDKPNHFSVECGPFQEDTFEFITAENWTLLVQAVDHWLEDINTLKTYFEFIPSWRLDDIMISYAPEGGSVGPHYDQYDVFLIQASGERLWKIGQQCDDQTELIENNQIKILKNFNSKAEYHCKAGDILYVPPGCAHWGISQTDDCMTISIGFRAPSIEELTSELLHNAPESLANSHRFTDPKLSTDNSPAKIDSQNIEHIRQLIQETLLTDELILRTFGKMMTEPKYAEDYVTFPIETGIIKKRPDSRLAYFVRSNSIALFANGEILETTESESFIEKLCSSEVITNENLSDSEGELIARLIDLGVFEDAHHD